MPYYRMTLTINDIVEHSVYYSCRLTVYLFGEPTDKSDYQELLINMVTEIIGYGIEDWWNGGFGEINEEFRTVEAKDAKGLGFYRVEVAYEDNNGRAISTKKYDAHTTKFGKEI